MDLSRLFIHNLKKWRKNRKLSQKALAERCNAAHSYIRQLESGSGHPSFAFIEKLANALRIEPYQLFYDATTAQLEDQPGQSGFPESIKTKFLEKVACEFDVALDSLKPRNN